MIVFNRGVHRLGDEPSGCLEVEASHVGLRFGQLVLDTPDQRRVMPTMVDGWIFCDGVWWSDANIVDGQGAPVGSFQADEVEVTDDYIRDYYGNDFNAWRHDFCKECGLGPWTHENGILTAEITDGD